MMVLMLSSEDVAVKVMLIKCVMLIKHVMLIKYVMLIKFGIDQEYCFYLPYMNSPSSLVLLCVPSSPSQCLNSIYRAHSDPRNETLNSLQ